MAYAVYSPEIEHRNQLADLCNRRGLVHHAVEIGVDKAGFATRFLSVWKGDTYYAIDPWQTDLPDYEDVISWDRDPDYRIAMAALGRFNDRVIVLRYTSAEAARFIKAFLSFVYIDGNHSPKSLKRDLDLFWEQVQPGGIQAIHDYDTEAFPEIVRIVDEWAVNRGVDLYRTHEPSFPTAYCYKAPVKGLLFNPELAVRVLWRDLMRRRRECGGPS